MPRCTYDAKNAQLAIPRLRVPLLATGVTADFSAPAALGDQPPAEFEQALAATLVA